MTITPKHFSVFLNSEQRPDLPGYHPARYNFTKKELMLLQWAQPQAALRQYEKYARLCEAEGLKPSNRVLALYNELLRVVEACPSN